MEIVREQYSIVAHSVVGSRIGRVVGCRAEVEVSSSRRGGVIYIYIYNCFSGSNAKTARYGVIGRVLSHGSHSSLQ